MKPAPSNCTIVRYDKADDVVIMVCPFRRAPVGQQGCYAIRLYHNGTHRVGGITTELYSETHPGKVSPRGTRVYEKLRKSGVYTRYRATEETIAAIDAGGVRQRRAQHTANLTKEFNDE